MTLWRPHQKRILGIESGANLVISPRQLGTTTAMRELAVRLAGQHRRVIFLSKHTLVCNGAKAAWSRCLVSAGATIRSHRQWQEICSLHNISKNTVILIDNADLLARITHYSDSSLATLIQGLSDLKDSGATLVLSASGPVYESILLLFNAADRAWGDDYNTVLAKGESIDARNDV